MNRRQSLQLLASGIAAASFVSPITAAISASAADFDRIRGEIWTERRRFARLPCGEIAYHDSGEGPAALFLHGFPLNGFQWRAAIETLSIFNRCIAPDFMGMGFTRPGPGQDLSPSSQLRMLIALLDQLGIAKVHLVANDSGGAVAQLFAAQHPERIRTILFTNCDTEIESPPAAMAPVIALAKEGRYAETWLVPWGKDKVLARSANGLGGMCFADPSHPSDAAIDMYLAPLIAGAERKALTDRYAVALEDNPLAGIGAKLKSCPAPVRILWGTSDTIFSRAGAEHLDRSFGRSFGVRKVPGAKLFWPEEQPKLIVEEALALWSRHPA
jgi:pimeloyl-ACP methyl ester carboxylesterase